MILKFLLALVLVSLLVVGCVTPEVPNPLPQPQITGSGVVVDVVDGDTVKIDFNGKVENVRLIGWDFPDISSDRIGKWLDMNLSRDVVVSCYYAGNDVAKGILENNTVVVTASNSEPDRDQYDRLLRFISVNGTDFGLTMLQAGYGVQYDPSPSKPCELCDTYSTTELQVKTASEGCLWAEGT